MSKRLKAFLLSGFIFVGSLNLTACKVKKEETEEKEEIIVEQKIEEEIQPEEVEKTSEIVESVNTTSGKIDLMLTDLNDDIKYDSAIMLHLDIIAEEDENGKISPDKMNELKSIIDVDNMIDNYNAFLDELQQKIILEEKVYRVSDLLPQELSHDKEILVKIEDLLQDIILYYHKNMEEDLSQSLDKLYNLFVKEEKIDNFEIRDLSYTSRAIANNYGEAAIAIARDYIEEERYEEFDKRFNDQNNKAYIKTILEMLSNQNVDESEVDIINIMNEKYSERKGFLKGKVEASDNTIKNLVNYMNLKYLVSGKVAKKDLKQIIGEAYNDSDILDSLDLIDDITIYNSNNQNDMIRFSDFLIDEYLQMEAGDVDKTALDFVQSNTTRLMNTKETDVTYEKLVCNPYFQNIYKFITNQDFKHIYKDGEKEVLFQNISEGSNFVNYEIILYTLNKLPDFTNSDNYKEVTAIRLTEVLQYIQNKLIGECKKIRIDFEYDTLDGEVKEDYIEYEPAQKVHK